MIASLLPDSVVAREAFTDPPEPVLLPEEVAAVARAVDKRRREFGTVRHLARQAMRALDLPEVAILPGERGAPTWPDGLVGSMTHCDGYRASALARRKDIISLGVDAEPHAPLPDGVREIVARPEEQKWLSSAPDGVCWDRLLFSAKESVYKAWFPMTGRWLDFSEAVLDFSEAEPSGESAATTEPVITERTITEPTPAMTENPAMNESPAMTEIPAVTRGSFTATLLVPGPVVNGRPIDGFTGQWVVTSGLVITAITVPV